MRGVENNQGRKLHCPSGLNLDSSGYLPQLSVHVNRRIRSTVRSCRRLVSRKHGTTDRQPSSESP